MSIDIAPRTGAVTTIFTIAALVMDSFENFESDYFV